MLQIKKILCPTDFSEPSYEAIKTAGELAFHFGSQLCLLHVVSPVPNVPIREDQSVFNVLLYEQELEAYSKKTLEEIVNHLEWRDLNTRLIALRGNPAEEIIRIANEEKVDLIVIATRGRTGFDRLVFGSVAEKVVRLALCPVLTISSRLFAEAKKETTEAKGEEIGVP
ncbi:MAG: universal stress protein [Thermodesulfobacteriota bacterium]